MFDDDDDRLSHVFNQREIDEANMKDLNKANRFYRKCFAGKCPPPQDRHVKTRKPIYQTKPKNFVSKKLQDKKLSQIWIESGRTRRIRIMEAELIELDTKIAVASGRTHMKDRENNFKAITRHIKEMEEMDVEIKKAKLEIGHLKSQFVRLQQKKDELSRETESEGKIHALFGSIWSFPITDQFTIHFRKANRQLEIYENRVEVSRQHECLLTAENRKLRELIKDMLFDRAVFNFYWSKTVKNLKDRRKFLLDMIERTNQAFNQGADFLDNVKKLQSRRMVDRELHVSEMVNMERQIDANHIMNMFLGGKGKKREMAPLEPREVRRRDVFKEDYTNRLNLYNSIIEKIKEFTGIPEIKQSMDHYMRQENDGFQFFRYLNEMNFQIEYLSNNCSKLSSKIFTSRNYNESKLKHFDQRIEELHKKFSDEINETLKLKDDRDKFEQQIEKYFDTIMEILKILNCDLSSVQMHLGDHKKVTVFNMKEFFSLLECRTNEVLAYVYCDQRKNVDILTDDAKLVVKSVKRKQELPVKIEDIITTQQCAECAEGADVNRYDDQIVYPLDHDTIKAIMRKKVETPEMAFRLHNLSKCNLPRSGVIAGRRYAE